MSAKCLTCQLYCAGMRILCYQYCCRCLHKKRIVKQKVNVIALGFTGAGKSHLLALLCSESTSNITPTDGFSLKDIPLEHTIMQVKELGGSKKIRPYWNHYMDDTNGVIFIISIKDISDRKLNDNKLLLESVMNNNLLMKKPLLVLLTQGSEASQGILDDIIIKLDLIELCKDSSFMIDFAHELEHTKLILQKFSDTICSHN